MHNVVKAKSFLRFLCLFVLDAFRHERSVCVRGGNEIARRRANERCATLMERLDEISMNRPRGRIRVLFRFQGSDWIRQRNVGIFRDTWRASTRRQNPVLIAMAASIFPSRKKRGFAVFARKKKDSLGKSANRMRGDATDPSQELSWSRIYYI